MAAFVDLADDVDGHAVVVEVFACPFGGDDVIAQFLEAFSQLEGFGFIAVGDGDEDRTASGDFHLSAIDGFVQGFGVRMADTHDFASRFHFRPEGDFSQADLAEREDRSLGGDVFLSRHEAAVIAHVLQGFAEGDAGCDFDNREMGDLAQEGNGTARTRVDFDDVFF